MKPDLLFYLFLAVFFSCNSERVVDSGPSNPGQNQQEERVFYTPDEFVMAADLSYVNQILDYGGVYRDSGAVEDPYKIFADYGTNVVRLRKWHTPDWTIDVYEEGGDQMYNDLYDVEESIRRSKEQGMAVNLDFHISDMWTDPGHQDIPEAWLAIETLEVLKDSVYNYVFETLDYLDNQGLMPEMVQIGNETNCGMLYSNATSEFPPLNICDGHWENLAEVINSGIQAVRDASDDSSIHPQIILHVAQPENVSWWFDNLTQAGVSDFDILGFSYYANWSDVPVDEISSYVSDFKESYDKEIMILETAYSWTMQNADDYGNIFGQGSLAPGYPATPDGQKQFMIELTQQVIDGGGRGVMYWEAAWITSDLRDLWGQGSSWENNTFFDFDGNVLPGIDFMTYPYDF